MKADTDDENINVHLVFFFFFLCVKEGAREPAGGGVQTMCAGPPDEGQCESRQINEPVESNKLITAEPACTRGVHTPRWGVITVATGIPSTEKLISAAKTCVIADGGDDKHNLQDTVEGRTEINRF